MSYLSDYRDQPKPDLYIGMSGRVRRHLDRIAQGLGQPDRHALFLPRVFSLCGRKFQRILELGCGDGHAMTYRGPSYTAIDRSDEFAQALISRGIAFFVADVGHEELPIPSRSVDLVMMNHIIEHIHDPEFVISEVRRVLAVNGHVYIRTPNIKRVGGSFWDDYTHVHPFTFASLNQLMRSQGFSEVFSLHSDHPRIMLDILTQGRFRKAIFSSILGGKEIESCYEVRPL